MILEVTRASELKPNSNKKILCMCDDCGRKFNRQYQLLNRTKDHRCYGCARKHIGRTMNREKIDEATRSRRGSKHPRWNPNKTEFLEYAYQVRQLSERVYQEHTGIINPSNHKRTICGVEGGYQLDHKVSVKEGFEKGIPVLDMGHINNLQLLPWRENRAKGA